MKVVIPIIAEEVARKKRRRVKSNGYKRRRTFGYILWLLFILGWIMLIWSFSMQTYQQQSIQPWLHSWAEHLRLKISFPDISFHYGDRSYSLRQQPYEFVEFLFRKTAHLFVYAVLGILVYASMRYRKVHWAKCAMISLIVVAAIACTDEYIQQFSKDRTSSVRDVGVDLLGGAAGILVWAGGRSLFRKKRQ